MGKTLYIYKLIPHMFTISAFMFGFNAILLAIGGRIEFAILSIVIASILDLFDGRVARILGISSKFGAELDSLSDLVCFGVATSIIVLFYINTRDNFLNLSVMFFSITSMIRLARFNIDNDYPEFYKYFFVGVPTPAGFLLGIWPIALDYAFNIKLNATAYAIYLIVVGFLMISVVPTISSKALKIPKKLLPILMAGFTLFIVSSVFYYWVVLSVVGISYIISILITFCVYISYLRKKRKEMVKD